MSELFEFSFFALGGPNELKIFTTDSASANQAFEAVRAEVARIESKYSRYRTDSIVSRINAAAGKKAIEVDPETAGLLNYAEACFVESKGLFDITSGVLRRVWNFSENILPEQKDVDPLLELIGWKNVSWEAPMFQLEKEGAEIDFGGIGKEYAVDRCAAVLSEQGITSALVNLAGDVSALGSKPDGQPWRVGIKNPAESGGTLGFLELEKGAVASSGEYERFMEVDGKRYSHILNPKTGWPVSDLQSVSIIASSCLVAGSMATIAMLLGEKRALQYLKKNQVQHLLVTASGRLRAFPGKLVARAA